MKLRGSALLGLVALVTVQLARPVRSNGDLFFEAMEVRGNPEYVVFGSAKDERGRFLDYVTVTVTVSEPLLSYSTQTGSLGRYRSLDVGRAIKGLGYEVDPSRISITATCPGYRLVRQLNRGKYRQAKGAFEVNFVMAKVSAR